MTLSLAALRRLVRVALAFAQRPKTLPTIHFHIVLSLTSPAIHTLSPSRWARSSRLAVADATDDDDQPDVSSVGRSNSIVGS